MFFDGEGMPAFEGFVEGDLFHAIIQEGGKSAGEGALDPGVVLYLFQGLGMSAQEVETVLYKRSGLLGISGISSDMRDLLASDAASAGRS